jgi:hypothetical protein
MATKTTTKRKEVKEKKLISQSIVNATKTTRPQLQPGHQRNLVHS